MNKLNFRTALIVCAVVALYGLAGMIDEEGEAITAAQTADILAAAKAPAHE